MIRVKDMYVSTDQIQTIKYEDGCGFCSSFLVIKYKFVDEPVKIEVDNFEEFVNLADDICTKVNFMKGA